MNNIVYTIEEIKSIVTPIAKRHQIAELYLFGSYAKVEATPDSDIDFLMDGGEIRSLFQLSVFRLDLEDALGKPIDLLTLDETD